jgi:hypothetical protein
MNQLLSDRFYESIQYIFLSGKVWNPYSLRDRINHKNI